MVHTLLIVQIAIAYYETHTLLLAVSEIKKIRPTVRQRSEAVVTPARSDASLCAAQGRLGLVEREQQHETTGGAGRQRAAGRR